MSHMEVGNLQGTYVITCDTIFCPQIRKLEKKWYRLSSH